MARERLLKHLQIDPETQRPFIEFDEIVNIARSEGETDNDRDVHVPFTCDSPFQVHDDLAELMTMLRKHGLSLLGIKLDDESKQLKNWKVTGLKVSGDHTMKQSRAVLRLSVFSDRTKKWSHIKTGQVTMYPKTDDASKYHDVDKFTPIVENIIDESWNHLAGKYGDDDIDIEENPQLILFPDHQEVG